MKRHHVSLSEVKLSTDVYNTRLTIRLDSAASNSDLDMFTDWFKKFKLVQS